MCLPLCAVEFLFWLLAARTAPVGGQILERDAVMFGGIIDIAADGADVLAGRRLEHDFLCALNLSAPLREI